MREIWKFDTQKYNISVFDTQFMTSSKIDTGSANFFNPKDPPLFLLSALDEMATLPSSSSSTLPASCISLTGKGRGVLHNQSREGSHTARRAEGAPHHHLGPWLRLCRLGSSTPQAMEGAAPKPRPPWRSPRETYSRRDAGAGIADAERIPPSARRWRPCKWHTGTGGRQQDPGGASGLRSVVDRR